MGQSKKPKYVPKSFESAGHYLPDKATKPRADTSANIYESMMISEAWADLNNRQRVLYLIAKQQYYGVRKPGKDYPDIETMQGDDKFYLNMAFVNRFHAYKSHGNKELYGDIKALEEHGFIKTISNGRKHKQRSVYQYSDGWKTWKPKTESV